MQKQAKKIHTVSAYYVGTDFLAIQLQISGLAPFFSFPKILVELLTGFVVGALYTNFVFHDLQQVSVVMWLEGVKAVS